jgi:hypothetical protein
MTKTGECRESRASFDAKAWRTGFAGRDLLNCCFHPEHLFSAMTGGRRIREGEGVLTVNHLQLLRGLNPKPRRR